MCFCRPASFLVRNTSSLLKEMLIVADFLSESARFLSQPHTHTHTHSCHSLVSVTHTHTLTVTLVFTVGHHTLCLDTSLYTNGQWIHSDVFFCCSTQTRFTNTDSHWSRLPPSFSSSSSSTHHLSASTCSTLQLIQSSSISST